MKKPLTAGEPLAPTPDPRRPTPPPAKKPKKRASLPVRVLRGLVGAFFGIAVLVAVVGAAAGWGAYRHFSAGLPDVEGLQNYQPAVMSRVYAGDGRLLSELATERRIFVPISAIPKLVQQAFVSAEDQNFWTHRGVDPLAIMRAAVFNLSHMGQGKRPVGASTITQQVAKNMLLDNELSLGRKIKEAILAIRIEENLTKDRILELYLNEIYLGAGAYGVAAAAQTYFNKTLDELNVQEAAFLAALPKAPNNYNPFRFPDAARARRDWVLDRMAEDRVITSQQATAAKAEPIVPNEFRRPAPIPGAEWFAEEVRRQLIGQFGQDVATQGGLMARTSLDPALQLAAEKALRDGLMAFDRKRGGWRGPVTKLELTGAALETDWPTALGAVTRPPGMLSDWKLAVVLTASDTEARLGWVESQGGGIQRQTGIIPISDIGWARPVRDGRVGGAPRRITDVMHVGDVVMVEPTAPPTAANAAAPVTRAPGKSLGTAGLPRLTLRQIPAIQGALVSLEPVTGRVIAMVGGWSFDQSQFNRATQAQRQPGSSFKPMVYLTALSRGLSPSQRVLDAPIVVNNGASGSWRPGNYEGTFNGPIPMRLALEKSLNLVTLRLAQYVGMDAVADTAIAFHMVDSMPRVLPAALGAVETTVLREAGAYGGLAVGGREVVPTLIDSVQDRNGHVVWRNPALACDSCGDAGQLPDLRDIRRQIADPASVFQLVTMMQGVVRRGTGYAAGKGLNRPIAGKTGTTQDFYDAWFTGFTADLVTSVWVGFDNPATLGNNETGGSVAAPIFHDYMQIALRNRPVVNFPQPAGVTMATWEAGVTDAFKPDQVPGASGPLITGSGVSAMSDLSAGDGTSTAAHGGVDSALPGLY
ncbi:MAG: penicillin-binding protein 1A [Acetobacteraceae bacterium]